MSKPTHIAVIMDGNGRWAKKRFMPRTAGHQAGIKATRRVIESCIKNEIPALTIFAFSSENWSRPEQEVSSLMDLFIKALSSEIEELHTQNVSVRFIGDRNPFSDKLQRSIKDAEDKTRENTGLVLSVAANYGGRWDIINAVRDVAKDIEQKVLSSDEISTETFSSYLTLSGLQEPDLLIRTGGEQRISNFLLWQLAYTELYFSDLLWPDFDEKAFEKALDWYSTRERRFGKTEMSVNQ